MTINDDIKIYYQQENPKKNCTAAYKRYEKYKKSSTIKQAKELGALSVDFKWDKAGGYMTIHGDNLTTLSNLCYDLLKQNRELTNRVEILEEYVQKQRTRNNYIEFLEQFKPDNSFDNFISSFNITETLFEKLFDDSLLNSMLSIFKEVYDRKEEDIIKCFTERPGVFYIYNNDGWNKMHDDQFKTLFNNIHRGLMNYFTKWESECFENGSDKIMITYMEVNSKIYTNVHTIYDKFKSKLYNNLKISFKNYCTD